MEALEKGDNGEPNTISLRTEALLKTAGRVPNIEGLNLADAGVSDTKQGILVNAYLQTSASHIYAASDILGHYQFTHSADFQTRVVVRNMMMLF